MRNQEILKREKEIISKINDKWLDLQKDFYICYSVKELAYEIAYQITNTLGQNAIDFLIYYKFVRNKHRIIFILEENIFFQCDIYWETSMYGDSGLKICNAKITNEIPNDYEYIEEKLQDDDEEEE